MYRTNDAHYLINFPVKQPTVCQPDWKRSRPLVIALPARRQTTAIGRPLVHSNYCPMVSVLSNSVFEVFITCTLSWYERDAEIMFTISSTTFTLGIAT